MGAENRKMLKSLYIKNFILIDELFLDFDKGINTFIGETGAGKTIIIKAIDIVFGAKCSREMPKNPNQKALIEITFDYKGQEIIISREISQTGTKSRVDGALVTLDYIKELREKLIDIHSQHQTYNYMQQKFHIKLLDSYISKNTPEFPELLNDCEEEFKIYSETKNRIEKLKENNETILREIEFLKFQIKEIEDLELQENEEENLKSELEILSNAQSLKDVSYGAYYTLQGNDENLCDVLSKIRSNLSSYTSLDKNLEQIEENLINLSEELKSCATDLRDYSESIEDNPQRLDEINERLSQIEKLKRKYGDNLNEKYNSLLKELENLNSEDNNLDELNKKFNEIKEKINTTSTKISEIRKEKGSKLSRLIEEELKKLEFTNPKFEIQISPKPFSKDGIDEVEFLITTNISQNLAPLIKVASGGEISRVMLGIKTVFATSDKIETVIFDEIDTGISGKTSQAVAASLNELGKTTQLIIVTHQAIIASKANRHFWVSKTQDGETKIQVNVLDEKGKLEALAQLASGNITETSLDFAKELLQN